MLLTIVQLVLNLFLKIHFSLGCGIELINSVTNSSFQILIKIKSLVFGKHKK